MMDFDTQYHVNNNNDIINKLTRLYGAYLEQSIIEAIAYDSNYEFDKANQTLAVLSRDATMKKMQETNPTNCFRSQISYKKLNEVDRIVNLIKQGGKILVLMRGLPGSGKSFLANQVVQESIGPCDSKMHVLSTDGYFFQNGRYEYNKNFLEEAHQWNKNRTEEHMLKGVSPILIDNTNLESWEMKPYCAMAVLHGYVIEILEANSTWRFNDKELSQRNMHGVSRTQIKFMMDRYEKDVTVPKMLLRYNLFYQPNFVSEKRRFPPLNNNVEIGETVYISDEENSQEDVEISGSTSTTTTTNSALNKWGLTEEELKTWSIVKELPKKEPHTKKNMDNGWQMPTLDWSKNWKQSMNVQIDEDEAVSVAHVATNTSSDDFNLVDDPASFLKANVLFGELKDINPKHRIGYTKPGRYDKGTETDDFCFNDDNSSDKARIDELSSLFQNIPSEYLKDVLDNCHGDTNWAATILLDDSKQLIEGYDAKKQGENTVTQATSSDEVIILDEDTRAEPIMVDDDNDEETDAVGTNESPPRHKRSWQETLRVAKEQIEKRIDFAKEHYSERLLKLKTARHPESVKQETDGPQVTAGLGVFANVGDVVALDSDVEFEEVVLGNEGDARKADNDRQVDSSDNELIEFNLGQQFVDQLQCQFGDPLNLFSTSSPNIYRPVVEMPKSLARQLHAFYMESVLRQMEVKENGDLEKMLREDEDFARRLQEQENSKNPAAVHAQRLADADLEVLSREPTNFKEIMVEQEALGRHNRRIEESWRRLLTPEDLASSLTRRKLCATFPTVSESVLMEVYAAHRLCYRATVDALLASGAKCYEEGDQFGVGGTKSGVEGGAAGIRDPPIEDSTVKLMREAYDDAKKTELEATIVPSDRPSTSWRCEAQRHQRRRSELMQQAQSYFRQSSFAVAEFYARLASVERQHFERCSHWAAEATLRESFRRLEDFHTLDLHHLLAGEAVAALDIFLDRCIALLDNGKKEQLHIITGRGKNSPRGRPIIKPRVIERLKQRGLRYEELNPGLLRVCIRSKSKLTSDLT